LIGSIRALRPCAPLVLLALALLCLGALAIGPAGTARAGDAPPEFPSLTLTYSDAQGTAVIASQGADSTGGTPISVTLTQNGMTLQGQGEAWNTRAGAPRSWGVAFWLSDGAGNGFFFDGSLMMGVDTFGGQGSWTYLQDPSITDQWRMFRRFP